MEEETKAERLYWKRKSGNVCALPSQIFDEMLGHAKPLLTMNGGCSEYQIKTQFRNLPERVIEAFLVEAIKRGMIKEEPFGTFTLQQLEIQVCRPLS